MGAARAKAEADSPASAGAKATSGLAFVVEESDEMEEDAQHDEPDTDVVENDSAIDPGSLAPPPGASGIPADVREMIHPTADDDVAMTSSPPAADMPAPTSGDTRRPPPRRHRLRG